MNWRSGDAKAWWEDGVRQNGAGNGGGGEKAGKKLTGQISVVEFLGGEKSKVVYNEGGQVLVGTEENQGRSTWLRASRVTITGLDGNGKRVSRQWVAQKSRTGCNLCL